MWMWNRKKVENKKNNKKKLGRLLSQGKGVEEERTEAAKHHEHCVCCVWPSDPYLPACLNAPGPSAAARRKFIMVAANLFV